MSACASRRNVLFFLPKNHDGRGLIQKLPILSEVNYTISNSLDEIRSWPKYGHIDSIVCSPEGAKQTFPTIIKENSGLKWIHSIYDGIDGFMMPEVTESEIILTNGRGGNSRGLAEFTLSMILQYYKNHQRLNELKVEKKWVEERNRMVYGQTMAIFGYGDIGYYVAQMAAAFGIKILAVKRNPHSLDEQARALCSSVCGIEQTDEILSQADIVCGILPGTPETHHFFNEERFSKMKKTAMFINVGRGSTADEGALLKALKEGTIAYAALDVFEKEPLSASSPLLELDNFFYSPHTGTNYDESWEDQIKIMETNLRRSLNGEELLNITDKKAGYQFSALGILPILNLIWR